MSDRGKGKGKGKGKGTAGRETPRGNRPSPYLVNSMDVVSPIPDMESLRVIGERYGIPQGNPPHPGIFSEEDVEDLEEIFPQAFPPPPLPPPPPPPPPPPVPNGTCPFCDQFSVIRDQHGWQCINPDCGAFNFLSGESFIGRIATAREEEERERCRRGNCNISGGKKSKKNKKLKKSRKTRR